MSSLLLAAAGVEAEAAREVEALACDGVAAADEAEAEGVAAGRLLMEKPERAAGVDGAAVFRMTEGPSWGRGGGMVVVVSDGWRGSGGSAGGILSSARARRRGALPAQGPPCPPQQTRLPHRFRNPAVCAQGRRSLSSFPRACTRQAAHERRRAGGAMRRVCSCSKRRQRAQSVEGEKNR